LGDRLIGPFFIHGILNQEKYHQLLVEYIDDFLDELPLAELDRIVFQQDRATLHNARINVNWLVEKIGSFRRKLQLWTRKINEDGGQDCFPKLHQYAASLMSSLSHKTCCPFSRNTFRSLLNGLQNT
jgi:hypothetical protein